MMQVKKGIFQEMRRSVYIMTEDERTALKAQEQEYILKGSCLARQVEQQQRVCETRRRQYEQACALLARREQIPQLEDSRERQCAAREEVFSFVQFPSRFRISA